VLIVEDLSRPAWGAAGDGRLAKATSRCRRCLIRCRAFMNMKYRRWTGFLTAALLAGTVPALRADQTRNPYDAIVARNAFALKPVPPETIVSAQPSAPGVEVLLTGISTVGGAKKVLLQITDKTPGKKTEYLPPLVENDVQGRVEVVSIDAEKGSVVLKIDGNEKTLTFEKDAPKTGGAAPQVPAPPPFPNPLVRAAGAVLLPPPPGPTGEPSAPPGRLGVMMGGLNASGPPGPPPAAAGADGAANRGLPAFPPTPRGATVR
jgi:hypothetical protein